MTAVQEARKAQTSIHLEPVQHTQETLSQWVGWMNNPEVRKWMYDDLPSSPEDINRWLYSATSDPRRHYFAITTEGKQIGFVSLRQDHEPENTGEIGIVIGATEYQGRGIGKQAVDAMMDYAKNSVHLTSVRAMIRPDNEKSIRLFTVAGFIRTGEATIQGTHMLRFDKRLDVIENRSSPKEEAKALFTEIGLVRPTGQELGEVAIEFSRQLKNGGKKNDETSSLMMIDTLLSPPDPERLKNEIGKHVLIVEYGGTKVRAAIGELGPDGQPTIAKNPETGVIQKIEGEFSTLRFDSPDAFFGELFRVIDTSPIRILPKTMPDTFGLIWSYVGYAERTPNGVDVHTKEGLSKGIIVRDMNTVSVGSALWEAIRTRYYPDAPSQMPHRLVVLNDTPAVLFSHVPEHKGVNQIGLVDGTGFNIAIHVNGKAYNLEAGFFNLPLLPAYAESVDRAYENSGRNFAEKQSSGKYVGDQFDAIVTLMLERGIIKGTKTEKLDGRDMDMLLQGNADALSHTLGRALTNDELTAVADCAVRLRDRAALIIGTLIGTIIRTYRDGFDPSVNIPVEGSFFLKTPGLSEIAAMIAVAVGGKPVTFLPGENLGIKGAVAAAQSM